jgi:ribonuclease I
VVACALVSWFWYQDERGSASVSADKTAQPKVSVGFITEPDRGTSPPRQVEPFDFYLLAMTLHPAFCADGHAREPECRTGGPVPLSIHGLWPENLEPGKYPRDCRGPPLDLDAQLLLELRPLMPGMADGLHEHEWRRHGTCSGLDDDEYYRHTLELARRLDHALRARLTTLAGRAASAAELREYAELFAPGIGASLTFHCRTLRDAPPDGRGQAYLVEIRQCVDNDGAWGAPRTPLDCQSVERRDQGCGRSFHIAGAARG